MMEPALPSRPHPSDLDEPKTALPAPTTTSYWVRSVTTADGLTRLATFSAPGDRFGPSPLCQRVPLPPTVGVAQIASL
jgi:hypothetical protein